MTLLAFLLLVPACLTIPVERKFQCTSTGYFANPDDCSTYYACSLDLVAVPMKCPAGTYFNPARKVCDRPENVNCIVNPSTTSEKPTTTSTTTESTTSEKPTTTSTTTESTTSDTPTTTESSTSDTPETTSTTTESSTSDTTTITSTTTIIIDTTTPDSGPRCPSTGNQILENPGDCATYYVCINGDYILLECPTGYGFNANTSSCVLAEEVGCDAGETSTTTANTTTSTTTESTTSDNPITDSTTTESTTSDNPITDSTTTESTTSDIPITDSTTTDSTTSENPTNNSTTTESTTSENPTNNSTTTESTTSENPTTNSTTTESTTSENPIANSTTTESTTSENPSTNSTTTESTTSENPSTNSTTTESTTSENPTTDSTTTVIIDTTTPGSGPRCPSTGHQIIENPDDCTTYYVCISGDYALLECPTGYGFNANTSSCVVAEEVGCGAVESITTTSSPPVSSGPNCPANGTQIFENPIDCTTYYVCIGGYYGQLECPTGYGFNANTSSCVPAEEVGCGAVESITTTSSPPVSRGPNCPANGTKIFENPEDCTTYYFCIEGDYALLQCPDGYEFKPENETCENFDLTGCR